MANPVEFYVEVGRRIRSLREKAGLTQEQLADRVSLTRTSITNIEKGRQKILLHTFADLAAELGCKPDALMPSSSTSRESLSELLKGRPKDEREFVETIVRAVREDTDHGRAPKTH